MMLISQMGAFSAAIERVCGTDNVVCGYHPLPGSLRPPEDCTLLTVTLKVVQGPVGPAACAGPTGWVARDAARRGAAVSSACARGIKCKCKCKCK